MRKYTNYASTTLSDNSLTSGVGIHPATHILPVNNGAGELTNFPSVSGDDYAYVTVENTSGDFEIMKLVAVNIAGPTVTVTRGTGAFPVGSPDIPTTLYSFTAGSRIEVRATAGSFEDVLQRDGDTIHGGVFGAAPVAPTSGTQTIVVKHSTDVVEAQISDVVTGEIAYNAKTNVLYAGGVDGSDVPELKTIIAGMHIGTTAPVAPYVVTGKLWFDTNPTVMALKIYSGGAWTAVLGTAGLASLILANNVALKAYIAAGGSTYDLIKLNATNELEIGQSTLLTLIKLLATNVEISPSLKLVSPGGVVGSYQLRTVDFGGDALLAFEPLTSTGVASGFGVNVKDDTDVIRSFAFDKNGFLTLPIQTPTLAGHAASKAYVDAAISGGTSAQLHAVGRVAANGTLLSGSTGVSVVRTAQGQYTVTIPPVSSQNAMVVACNIVHVTGTDYGATVFPTSTTTFNVDVGTGSSWSWADLDFMFTVFDAAGA